MTAIETQPAAVNSAHGNHDLNALGDAVVPLRRFPRWLTALAPALATVLLGIALLTTMYFTLLDWEWVTFLGGVLFAALLALASRASRAEWAATSNMAELAKIRERLAQELTARKAAGLEVKAGREQMRVLADCMSAMVTYVDGTERVRFHNRAFREWLGLRSEQIDGQLMRDVIGLGNYSLMHDRIEKALAGEQVNDELTLSGGNSASQHMEITYLSDAADRPSPTGFFAVLVDRTHAHDASAAKRRRIPEGPMLPLVVTDDNGQTLYLNSMTEQLTGWANPEARLRHALRHDEFRLYCQEMTATAASATPTFGYEILIRLQEEEDNLTPPGAFIPVAEEYGMTTELDYWVLRNLVAWHRLRRANTAYWKTSAYFVNLFSSTLHDPKFGDFVRKALAEKEVPPHVLCFEVNEDEAVNDLAGVARFASKLRRTGCRISLAAFTGRKASFDVLRHLPLDFLKIDGDVVRNIDTNEVNRAKLKAIARVSKVIGLQTIAPFVENDAVRTLLTEFGIDYVQGYAVRKPHSIEDLR